MNQQPLSWRGVYTTYRFCAHGRIWSAWRAYCYVSAHKPVENQWVAIRSVNERPVLQLKKGTPYFKSPALQQRQP
jgi:hypothetical protein